MMPLNRRNVLIVLGVLTVAGGALFGAGAFSQVQADRTMTADTAGDGSAYLQFSNTNSYAEINGDDELEVTVDSLNTNATTEINNTFDVSFGTEASGTYDVYVQSDTGLGSDAELDFVSENTGDSIVGSANSEGVGDTSSLSVAIKVDLTGDNTIDNVPAEFTIVAEQQ